MTTAEVLGWIQTTVETYGLMPYIQAAILITLSVGLLVMIIGRFGKGG